MKDQRETEVQNPVVRYIPRKLGADAVARHEVASVGIVKCTILTFQSSTMN